MSSHSGTISVMPGHDPTSVPFQVGDLACEFRLVHDPSGPNSSRLRLEWTEARSDSVLKVTEGSIAAFFAHSASSPQELLDRRNRPAESFFPPTSRGALYLWAAPYSYTDHTAHYHASHVYYVKIELTTPDDGLFTWERRVAELEARTAALSLASAAAASRCLSECPAPSLRATRLMPHPHRPVAHAGSPRRLSRLPRRRQADLDERSLPGRLLAVL